MKYLITGGCGFLGSNLSAEVLSRGEELIVFDNLSRHGASFNLEWLQEQGKFHFVHGDIRNPHDIERTLEEHTPEIIFHLSGQVAMSTSLEAPRRDFEINALGGINLLEAVRHLVPEAIVVYSSTNKVYGDLEHIEYEETPTRYVAPQYPDGFDESLGLDFRTPYGCSKGSADQYMGDYAHMFGLKTIVFRHSSIFGGRQFATYDQGWVGWFVQQALDIQSGKLKEPFTISGNGKQVRDIVFAGDLVRCYFSAIENIEQTRGQVFNIGGGMENTLSLLELFSMLESKLNVKMAYRQLPFRASDQKIFCADFKKATQRFGWRPTINKQEGIEKMIAWCANS